MHSNLSEGCYQLITGSFYWGQYLQFKVIINYDTGYFNATSLCRDNGKQFKDWNHNDTTKLLYGEFHNIRWKT